MDDALALCAVDLCGRPYLQFDCSFPQNMVGSLTPLCATSCQLIAPCHLETSIPVSTTAAFVIKVGTLLKIQIAINIQRIRVTLFINLCFLMYYKLPFVESLQFDCSFPQNMVGSFDTALVKEFFYAMSYSAGMNIHIKMLSGENSHHMIEAVFKAFSKALDEAVSIDGRVKDVLSTKGSL